MRKDTESVHIIPSSRIIIRDAVGPIRYECSDSSLMLLHLSISISMLLQLVTMFNIHTIK